MSEHTAEIGLPEEARIAVREALADAWDLGYHRGVRDAEGNLESADNPFRTSVTPPAAGSASDPDDWACQQYGYHQRATRHTDAECRVPSPEGGTDD